MRAKYSSNVSDQNPHVIDARIRIRIRNADPDSGVNIVGKRRIVDPDCLQSGSGILAQSGSTMSQNPDPVRIRIHNRTFEDNFFKFKNLS
jgi:hypothetical protein